MNIYKYKFFFLNSYCFAETSALNLNSDHKSTKNICKIPKNEYSF